MSPKLSLLWRPTPDLLLRGSLSRGFQAPDLASVYGGVIGGNAFVIDRPNCLAAGGTGPECAIQGFESQIVPNPSLQPERAWQGGLGLVWQAGAHVDLALDAWRLAIEDQVGILRAQTIVDNEIACAAAGRACDRLTEGEVLRTAQGTIISIVQPRINIARQDASGIDLDIGVRLLTELGDWRWRLRASHLFDLEQRRSAGSPTENQLQFFGSPDLRASSTLGWSSGAHALNVVARFTDGYRACALPIDATGASDPACQVVIRSQVELDGQWQWQAPFNADVAIGVRNWRNRPVPVSPSGEFAYGLYDPIGRVWYASYAQRF